MLIDDADTTLMVLYDTVRYTGILLTVRVEYRAYTETHAYRSPDPCQFEGHLSLHPTSPLNYPPLFVAYPFIRLQLYPIPLDSTTQLLRFQSLSPITYQLSLPGFLTQPIFARISRIRTSTQSVAQFSMQPSLRFRATMTSVCPASPGH